MQKHHMKYTEPDAQDINFQLGMYFHKINDFKTSEKYLRYAANSGNSCAEKVLDNERDTRHFLSEDERVNLAAIDILEQLVTPSPSEEQITQLESAINCILKSYK